MEAMHLIILRTIVYSQLYARNEDIRKDLQIPAVSKEIQWISDNYKTRTLSYPYSLADPLYDKNSARRLKKKIPNI
ncbi:hypothetical protein M0804_013478 [Polistes exclamans]|nr:hypothetical protein M0804_013478 [Polistes exclamans]